MMPWYSAFSAESGTHCSLPNSNAGAMYTIGEEWGFIGSVLVVGIYLFLISRLIILSERQKDKFARIYGYCVACCFFMHFFINIGMTMGLVPVIGIPLPLLSYGGSSLWSFTTLLFIFIRLDMERWRY